MKSRSILPHNDAFIISLVASETGDTNISLTSLLDSHGNVTVQETIAGITGTLVPRLHDSAGC